MTKRVYRHRWLRPGYCYDLEEALKAQLEHSFGDSGQLEMLRDRIDTLTNAVVTLLAQQDRTMLETYFLGSFEAVDLEEQ